MHPVFLAIDFGAESGRVMALELDGSRFELSEIHRFQHQPIALPSGLHWDISGLWREVVVGLTRAASWASERAVRLVSVGVDAWGVDWGLLGRSGELLGLPHAYRDERYPKFYPDALQIVSPREIYEITGIQLMPINTLFSLYAQQRTGPELLTAADHLLLVPDLFHYWLSGVRANEATIASTSQLIDLRSGQWSEELIQEFGFPRQIFHPTRPAGTVLGPIRAELAAACRLPADLQVVLPASHDTASAVAAVPAQPGTAWCYLSSGTWSLLGAETAAPCTNEAARAANFTNEGGVAGRFRFLKNIAGLWLVQQVRQDYLMSGQTLDYPEMTAAAAAAEPFRALFPVDRPELLQPGGMRGKIDAILRDTGRAALQSPGGYTRSCLESLAWSYRQTFRQLERVLDKQFDCVHLVGGGGHNDLLNQMTADALNRPVIVGPYEATAIGNGLVQALALGQLRDLESLRSLVAASESLRTFVPQNSAAWDDLCLD
jgi:rhamnulokinase